MAYWKILREAPDATEFQVVHTWKANPPFAEISMRRIPVGSAEEAYALEAQLCLTMGIDPNEVSPDIWCHRVVAEGRP
jgi:hypothetical protein